MRARAAVLASARDPEVADNAVFRDEPMRFSIGAENEAAADELRRNIEAMRASGELAEIIARMRLE